MTPNLFMLKEAEPGQGYHCKSDFNQSVSVHTIELVLGK